MRHRRVLDETRTLIGLLSRLPQRAFANTIHKGDAPGPRGRALKFLFQKMLAEI
jgi:hypothetical protein